MAKTKYDERIEKLAEDYVDSNYDSFTKGKDYAALEKRYSDQGRRAMDDTVGQIAARTGGLASSYAVSAGQQAHSEYMGRLEDAARGLYDSQQSEKLSRLGVARDMQEYQRSEAERALSDFSNDVYMDMYLAGDEDLAKMNFEDFTEERDMTVPEGFGKNDFEMLRRQVAAAKAPQYGESLSAEELQAYIDSGKYGTKKLNNDYYQLYGKNMPGYFGEDYEYDYERISELAKSKDGHGILKYVDSVIATAQTEEEAEAMMDVLYDMVAHFGYDLDELNERDKKHNGKGIAGR